MSLEKFGEIEVTSEASEEMTLVNYVLEVAGVKDGCNQSELQVTLAPNFKKHSLHGKKSIHIPIRMHGMTATTLIDCGATDNFINLGFLK